MQVHMARRIAGWFPGPEETWAAFAHRYAGLGARHLAPERGPKMFPRGGSILVEVGRTRSQSSRALSRAVDIASARLAGHVVPPHTARYLCTCRRGRPDKQVGPPSPVAQTAMGRRDSGHRERARGRTVAVHCPKSRHVANLGARVYRERDPSGTRSRPEVVTCSTRSARSPARVGHEPCGMDHRRRNQLLNPHSACLAISSQSHVVTA